MLLFVRFINLPFRSAVSLFVSHTLKDYCRMRSHTVFLLWQSVQAVCENSSGCRQTGIVFAALFTIAADSRTGKHERLRKCVTQFSASSLPLVVDWLVSVKTKKGGREEGSLKHDSTDSQKVLHPCLHGQCEEFLNHTLSWLSAVFVTLTVRFMLSYCSLYPVLKHKQTKRSLQGGDTLTGTHQYTFRPVQQLTACVFPFLRPHLGGFDSTLRFLVLICFPSAVREEVPHVSVVFIFGQWWLHATSTELILCNHVICQNLPK